MPDLRLGNVFQLPSRRISRRWTRSGTNHVIFLGALCAQTNLFWRTTGITMKITQSTGMATQMQLKVLFGRKSHGRPDFQKEKATTKSCVFRRYFLTEKELERVIENKGDEFRRKKNMEIQSGGQKMRNASAQQGAASKVNSK